MDLYLIIFADATFYQIQGIPYGINLNVLEHSELRYLIDGVEEQEKFNSSIALHQLIMRQQILAPFLHTNEHGNIITKSCMYFTPVIGHIKGLGLGVGLYAEKDWLMKNATKVVLLKGQSMGTIAGQMYQHSNFPVDGYAMAVKEGKNFDVSVGFGPKVGSNMFLANGVCKEHDKDSLFECFTEDLPSGMLFHVLKMYFCYYKISNTCYVIRSQNSKY